MNTCTIATITIAVCLTVVTATGNSCTTDITGKVVAVPRDSTGDTFVTPCIFCRCVEWSDKAMCNSVDCPQWMGHKCPQGKSFKDVPGKCCRQCL